jgi:hypothetical protein
LPDGLIDASKRRPKQVGVVKQIKQCRRVNGWREKRLNVVEHFPQRAILVGRTELFSKDVLGKRKRILPPPQRNAWSPFTRHHGGP